MTSMTNKNDQNHLTVVIYHKSAKKYEVKSLSLFQVLLVLFTLPVIINSNCTAYETGNKQCNMSKLSECITPP